MGTPCPCVPVGFQQWERRSQLPTRSPSKWPLLWKLTRRDVRTSSTWKLPSESCDSSSLSEFTFVSRIKSIASWFFSFSFGFHFCSRRRVYKNPAMRDLLSRLLKQWDRLLLTKGNAHCVIIALFYTQGGAEKNGTLLYNWLWIKNAHAAVLLP